MVFSITINQTNSTRPTLTMKKTLWRLLLLGMISYVSWYTYTFIQSEIDPIRTYPPSRPREAFYFAKTRLDAKPGIVQTLADIRSRKVEASARVEFLNLARKMGDESEALIALNVLDEYGKWQISDDIMTSVTPETQAAYRKYRKQVLERNQK